MESGLTSEELSLVVFYGSRNFPDETYLDACNSGFEYGRPLPIELSADKGANWDAEVNVRLFVARGQVLSLEQNNLTPLGEIHLRNRAVAI